MVFWSIQGESSFFRGVLDRFQKKKTLSAEYPGYTGDHSIVFHFQLKRAVILKSHAESAVVKWQESHFSVQGNDKS